MTRVTRLALPLCVLLACDSPAPASTAKAEPAPTKAAPEPPIGAKTTPTAEPTVATPTPEPTVATPTPDPTVATPTPDPTVATPTPDPTAVTPSALPDEVAIQPWSATTYAAVWTEKTAPSEPLVFAAEVYAGVVGQAGRAWHQVDATGELVPLVMDTEPSAAILGFWPSDAWQVQWRSKKDADFEYQENRLMKLRGGDRWVPQTYRHHEQWFHPGTGVDEFGRSEYDEAHMSTRSGMLMYPGTFEHITRVAGKHDDPVLGLHRGRAVDFFETGAGKIYTISFDGGAYLAQTDCEDETCVAAKAKRLPPGGWRFDRRVSRGKHSISVIAIRESQQFILHHRGKSDGWLLDALPADEKVTGMWSSDEGGLWTTHGEIVRWRDTESAWRDVTLPAGLSKPSVALSSDRKTVWLAGEQGGVGKVFTTPANAAAP